MENTQLYADPWSRIEAVRHHCCITSVNAFARYLGLLRGENLYQIKKGHNGISPALAKRICNLHPEINPGWLLMGRGEMLLAGSKPEPEPEPERVFRQKSEIEQFIEVLFLFKRRLDEIYTLVSRL